MRHIWNAPRPKFPKLYCRLLFKKTLAVNGFWQGAQAAGEPRLGYLMILWYPSLFVVLSRADNFTSLLNESAWCISQGSLIVMNATSAQQNGAWHHRPMLTRSSRVIEIINLCHFVCRASHHVAVWRNLRGKLQGWRVHCRITMRIENCYLHSGHGRR